MIQHLEQTLLLWDTDNKSRVFSFKENECIKEELLFVDYFECRCTGQDIFKMVRSYFDSHEMKLSQVVSVSTD